MIPFNKPLYLGEEDKFVLDTIKQNKIGSDGLFTQKCNHWIETKFGAKKSLLTTSGTHALEMSAILCDIKDGDEIIMPSYTFVSTANAFVMRGAKIVFIDIRPDTMNIDENLIENAITSKTKAIVAVHYAGIACELDTILDIANKNNLLVIEDAAQGFMSKYKNKPLGTIGHLGCFSFHETKNYSMGEGGALLVNDKKFINRSEIIRENGTNRASFFRGNIDKYTWIDIGSSYLPSEINAAYLYAQLKCADLINDTRMNLWNKYYKTLNTLKESGDIGLPYVPKECQHNGHMFYIKCKNLSERTKLIEYLKSKDITSVFHYVPLHSSPAGLKFGRFVGEDIYTTKESESILRLPLYYDLKTYEIEYVCDCIKNFYR